LAAVKLPISRLNRKFVEMPRASRKLWGVAMALAFFVLAVL
jgi:hypothetical protein